MGICRRCSNCFLNLGYYVGSVVLLMMRLYYGVQFAMMGWEKIHDIPKIIEMFTGLNIMYPEYMAYLVGYTELIAGALLVVGFLSRLAAIPLIAIMAVAYFTTHYEGMMAIFSDPTVFMAQEPFMFALTSLLVFAYGAGALSLDGMFCRKSCNKCAE